MTEYYTKPFYQSRKWWAWIIGQGFALFAASKGLIDWQWVLAPALGFSVGQGLADLGKNRGQAESGGTVGQTGAAAAEEKEYADESSEPAQQAAAAVPAAAPSLMQPPGGRFDSGAFRAEVMHRAKTIYCEAAGTDWESPGANWPGRFYASAAYLAALPAYTIGQVLAAWDEHLRTGERAFGQLFGFTLDDACDHLNEGECPARTVRSMVRQKGDAYYAIYLELVRARIILDELEQIEARALDWQSVLGMPISVYHVGERADIVLDPAKYNNEGGRLVPRPGIGAAGNYTVI